MKWGDEERRPPQSPKKALWLILILVFFGLAVWLLFIFGRG
jgi:hypothetical protein